MPVHVDPKNVPLGGDYWQGGYGYAAPLGGGDVHPAAPAPVWGFADVHAHPMAHRGFGGNLLFGQPDGPMEQALGWCVPAHGVGGTGILPTGANPLYLAMMHLLEDHHSDPAVIVGSLPEVGHLPGGYPQFDGWPRFTTTLHQKMYVDWIRRAYEGGLRLMVALVINNEALATLSGGSNGGDRVVVDDQVQWMQEFVGSHPASGFMEIAYTPSDARRIVGDENKLAVVLGVEVDSLGGWGREGDASGEEMREYLHYLYEIGVRHVFPIHLANNALGGTALYLSLWNAMNGYLRGEFIEPRTEKRVNFDLSSLLPNLKPLLPNLNNWPNYSSIPPGHANALGLTSLGQEAVKEMMRLGMIIDIDHMSWNAIEDTYRLAECRDYPLVAGHAAFNDLAPDVNGRPDTSEYSRTPEHLRRIRALGGMVAVGLHQSDVKQFGSRMPSDAPGSAKSWAQAYLYAAEQMGGMGVAMGTDINGFEGKVAPRFGLNACYDIHKKYGETDVRRRRRRDYVYAQGNGVRYQEPIKDYRAYRFEGVLEQDVYDMEERDIWEAIAIHKSGTNPDAAEMPGLPKRTPWQQGKIRNLAKGFRATSESQLQNPLFGGQTYNEQRAAFLVRWGRSPEPNAEAELKRLHGVVRRIWERWHAMEGANTPLSRSYAGRRDFDINIDGVAHYGLLPDFLQDLKNAGLTHDDLASLFRSAEDYIQMWEKCERRKRKPGERPELQLRRIAHGCLGITGGFSVVRDVLGGQPIAGTESLRSRLEDIAL